MALGDLLGTGLNTLVVITTEGLCYLFDVPYQQASEILGSKSAEVATSEDKALQLKFASASRQQQFPDSKTGPSLKTHSFHHSMAQSAESSDSEVPVSTQESQNASSRSSTKLKGMMKSDSAATVLSNKISDSNVGTQQGGSTKSTREDFHQSGHLHERSASSGAPNPSKFDSLTSLGPSSTVSHATPHSTKGIEDKLEENFGMSSHSASHADEQGEGNTKMWPAYQASGTQAASKLGGKTERLEPIFKFFVAGNGTCAVVTDVDEDGQCELVIGSSNRVVYSYGIAHETDGRGAVTTKLKLKNKWTVPGQVGSLSLSLDHWGRPILVVAQNGGNYTTIDHRGNTKYRQLGLVEPTATHATASHEKNAPTQIRHLVRPPFAPDGSPQDPILLAMAGLDGSLKLQEESSKLLWEKHIANQLFALTTLDVTKDGRQEIIACAWDGTTFIYDQDGNCVEFVFEERVSAFCAGMYSVSKGNQQPCLFFLTFSDHLYIYYNLAIKSIPTKSLITRIRPQFEISKNTRIDKGGPWTRVEQARLVKSLLDPSKFDESAAIAYKAHLERRLAELNSPPDFN